MQQESPPSNRKEKLWSWLKKIGIWGFLFFLVKGLLWLVLGYWVLN
ncbi:alanyl-tRNA synthetase [Pedobacter sp. HMWF019]|nr:alanyl-tRNA synthetase [Pedobacter sp. HMWF019]